MPAFQKQPSQSVRNATVPAEGPKCVPLLIDFHSGSTNQLVDMTSDNDFKILTVIQGIFIDNSTSTSKTVITVAGSQQVISCPAGWQGFFPLFAPIPCKFTVQNTGGTDIWITLYNMAMPASAWPGGGAGTPLYDANGRLLVSDQLLDAIISDPGSGNSLAVMLPGTAAPGDAKALAPFLSIVSALNVQYNGTTTELMRGTNEGTAIASASRASGTTTNSADIINYSKNQLSVTTNITSAGAGTVTVKVQQKDLISGLYVDIPGAITTALTGVGTYIIQIAPALTPVANSLVSAVIPRTLRITQTTGGGVNTTNSVSYCFV